MCSFCSLVCASQEGSVRRELMDQRETQLLLSARCWPILSIPLRIYTTLRLLPFLSPARLWQPDRRHRNHCQQVKDSRAPQYQLWPNLYRRSVYSTKDGRTCVCAKPRQQIDAGRGRELTDNLHRERLDDSHRSEEASSVSRGRERKCEGLESGSSPRCQCGDCRSYEERNGAPGRGDSNDGVPECGGSDGLARERQVESCEEADCKLGCDEREGRDAHEASTILSCTASASQIRCSSSCESEDRGREGSGVGDRRSLRMKGITRSRIVHLMTPIKLRK